MKFSDIIIRMNRFRKANYLLLLALVVLVVVGLPHTIHASLDLFGIRNILFDAVGKMVLGIAWLISWIVGLVVFLLSWLAGVGLKMSTGIASSPPVKIGFPITLAFANLCFVLAIVVIAVATIVRFQSYGIKQALWRLVVIAILVNFGLVIANAFLGFSDSLAMYFLKGVTPTSVGGGVTTADGREMSFVSALSGAFQPQSILGGNLSETSGSAMADAATGPNFVVRAMAQLVMAIGLGFVIILTLGALVIMLIIRYIKLGYLLIILPIAWAGFIFPQTRSYWSNWWDNFLKNVFFTPIVLFFLWLVMQIGMQIGDTTKNPGMGGANDPSNPLNAAAGLGSGFGNLVIPFLNAIILMGLSLGGLNAAQKFGFGIAGSAAQIATGAGKAVGRFSKRAGGKVVDKTVGAGMRATGRSVTQSGLYKKAFNKMQAPGGWLKTRTLGKLGGAMQARQVASVKSDIAAAEKQMAGMNTDQIMNYVHRTREGSAEQALALKKIAETGRLNQLPNAQKYFAEGGKNEAVFKNLGMASDWKKARNESGLAAADMIMATAGTAGPVDYKEFSRKMQSATAASQAAYFSTVKPGENIFGMAENSSELKSMRENTAHSILNGFFTGSNRSDLFRELSKNPDQVDKMKSAMQEALRSIPGAAGQRNIQDVKNALVASGNRGNAEHAKLANWLNSNSAQELAHDFFLI